MIHDIGLELGDRLAARGFPLKGFPIVDGPEPTETVTFGRERIVIQRDPNSDDAFGPPRGNRRLAKNHRYTRSITGLVKIYAQSGKSGALPFEHENRAEAVVDMVTVALAEVASVRRNILRIQGGRYVTPPDLAESEQRRGVLYVIRFTFDRAVAVQSFNGAGAPTATLGGITRTTRVGLANAPDDAVPDTACGEE